MSQLAGTAIMLRLTARRERLRVPMFVLVAVVLVASTAAQSESLYPTRADREAYAASIAGNPGLIAMVGPPDDLFSVGGDVSWQLGGFGAVGAALMSMFVLGRHTRAEEQSGRSELVGAAPVGRYAPVTAALVVAIAAQLLLGAAVVLTMLAYQQPAAGSLALGASIAAAGVVFAGAAAVAVQLSQTTASAYGIVGALLGGAYLVRAAGDVGDGTLSWLSPIGWAQAMRPYAGERWWPLALLLAATVALAALAYALRARRDDGAGLVAQRPGPAHAGKGLTGALGLTVRLQRGALIGWSLGLFFSGLSTGLTGRDAEALVGDNDDLAQFLGGGRGDVVDQYFAVSMLSMALVGTGFALQVALRLRSEETSGRLEPLLAGAVPRRRWVGAYALVAMAGTVVVLAANGIGAGIADAANAGDAGQLPRLVAAAVAPAPAVWVLVGLAVALVGLVPRAAVAAWGALVGCFLLSLLGPLLDLPGWALDLSPFKHVPQLPGGPFDAAPLMWLTLVAAAFTGLGIAAFARRDVPR